MIGPNLRIRRPSSGTGVSCSWPMLKAKKGLVMNAFVALWMADLKIDSQRLSVGCWCVAAALAAGHRIPLCAECDCQRRAFLKAWPQGRHQLDAELRLRA
jgi:hypothetical protein